MILKHLCTLSLLWHVPPLKQLQNSYSNHILLFPILNLPIFLFDGNMVLGQKTHTDYHLIHLYLRTSSILFYYPSHLGWSNKFFIISVGLKNLSKAIYYILRGPYLLCHYLSCMPNSDLIKLLLLILLLGYKAYLNFVTFWNNFNNRI